MAKGYEWSLKFHGNPPACKIPDGHPGSVSSIAKYIPVARFSYEPPASEQGRRSRAIRALAAWSSLVTTGAPEGSSSMMTSNNEREYAIAEISINQQDTSCRINPWKAVWATYVGIDGVNYVSTLSNQLRPGSHLLWGDAPSSDPLALYIYEDHLGIRQVVARCEEARPASEEEGPAWWHTVLVVIQTLEFKSDGVKLRKCCAPKLWPKVSWSVPLTPVELQTMDLFYWKTVEEDTRMVHFDFNQPGTVGYFICWLGNQVSLRAHKSDRSGTQETVSYTDEDLEEMRRSFNEENNGLADYRNRGIFEEPHRGRADLKPLRWTYHPLNPGEIIEQVWIRGPIKRKLDTFGLERTERWSRGLDVGIALVTNTRRTMAAARFPPCLGASRDGRSPWYCAAKVAETSKTSGDYRLRIFLSPAMPLMAAPAGVESDSAPERAPVLWSLDRPPGVFFEWDKVCHSVASLKGVAQVIVCEPKGREIRWPIMGLLFRYTNGHAASVGLFRPDRNLPILAADGSPGLFVRPHPDCLFLKGVATTAPKKRRRSEWEMFPWDGALEWWFMPSSLHMVVRHIADTSQARSAEFWIRNPLTSP